MVRPSLDATLTALCTDHALGWVLEDDQSGVGKVWSGCVFTWPEKEIVAVAGPLRGGGRERREILRHLLGELERLGYGPVEV